MKVKYLFDLDGTLTREESLPFIARMFGLAVGMKELTIATRRGEIPFAESFLHRVDLLSHLPEAAIRGALRSLPLNEVIINFIKDNPDDCVIVSSNLDIWIRDLIQDIGCQFFSSCLNFSEEEFSEVNIVDKASIVEDFQRSGYFVVFIGDGANDYAAFQRADLSIACGIVHKPATSLMECCSCAIFDEKALVRFLIQLKNPIAGCSVVICAAGCGTRLGLNQVKALVNVAGIPLLGRALDGLQEVDDIRVTVGFQWEQVIDYTLSKRTDVAFIFNREYETTSSFYSFFLGSRFAREYTLNLDGDLLINPADLQALLSVEGEYIGFSDPSTEHPIGVELSRSGQVVAFSTDVVKQEWTGVVKLHRESIKISSGHVYEALKDLLPMQGVYIRAHDIDTPKDLERSLSTLLGWRDAESVNT